MNKMNQNQRIRLFITILLKILHSKIKFIRTKEQPLLPNQSLMQPNKFKTAFIKFIENFNLKRNAQNMASLQTVQIYHKDKKRSTKILALFVNSLQEIEKSLMSPIYDEIDTDKIDNSSVSPSASISSIQHFNNRKQHRAYHNNNTNHNNNNIIYNNNTNHNYNDTHNNNIIINNKIKSMRMQTINPYSIYVPLNPNYTLKYQFISFNPLCVRKIMIISNRSRV